MKISSLTLFAGVVSAGCHPHSTCSSVTKVYTSLYTHLKTHTDAKTDVKTKTNIKLHTNVEKNTCVETNTGVRKYTSVQTACTSKPGKPADHTCACHTKGPKTSCIKWTTKPIPTPSCTTPTPKPKCSTKGPCHGTTTIVHPSPKPICPTSQGKGPCSSVKPVPPKPTVGASCSSKLFSVFASRPEIVGEFEYFWLTTKESKCIPSFPESLYATLSSAYETAAAWTAKNDPTIKAIIEECKKEGITEIKDRDGHVHKLADWPNYVFLKTWKKFLASYPNCDSKRGGAWDNGGHKGDSPKPATKAPKPVSPATTPAALAKPTPYVKPHLPSNETQGHNYTNPKTPEQFQGGSIQVNGWNSAILSVISMVGFFAFMQM